MSTATILYVEDNDDNVYVLKNRLERAGYQVHIAVDGQQGVDMAKDLLPDLIIMDLILPELDGWEATRQIKADGATSNIPIIALSSSAMPADSQRALDMGCERFDTKPVDFTRLKALIDDLLKA
jgi:CheY-like chemotaxis protein